MTDKNTADKHAIDNNVAQGIAAYIDYLNQLRVSTLMDTLRQILNNETGQLKDLAERQANALRNLDLANQNVMNIVNSGRGGENGMHGFIAEFAQTGIANARRAFEGLEKSTITLNNNGPADLLINGKPVQVKFYANLMNELKTSAEYRSMDMMFSKDHMDVFRAVMHGDKEVFLNGQPLTSNQVQKIKQIIEEESNIRGLSWDKWMQSSVLKYDQVQREAIDRTFTEETDNIKRQTSEQKSEISNKANTDKAAAYHKAQPNLGEANKAAGVGAAIQGGVIAGDVKDVLLLDVTPLSLGIETMGGVMTVLIERNTTIPTTKSQVFSTAADNQPAVDINVLQGERSMARDNKQLGLFKLDGIEPAPRGVPQIEVTFSIDVNGIVNVKAKDLKTQKEQSIVIQNSTGLSDEEIDRMVKEAEANKAEDEKKRKDIETRNKAEQMINEIDKALAEQGDKIDANQKQQAEQLKTELKTALDNNDMATLESKMSELEQMAQQMASYAYQQQQANPNGGAGQTTSNNNDDNVVDADFEEKN